MLLERPVDHMAALRNMHVNILFDGRLGECLGEVNLCRVPFMDVRQGEE